MKKTKKLLAILGTSMIAVSAFSLPASAANISDTNYTFNFNWVGQANTSGRGKQNASSTYIKCNQLPNGMADLGFMLTELLQVPVHGPIELSDNQK